MKVYLVYGQRLARSDERIVYAVMANEKDAKWFAKMLECKAKVEERTLIYGQPPNRGYNQ